MKLILKASILAITLISAVATVQAHDRYPEDGRYYRGRGYEAPRCNEPEVYFDRFGNRVFIARTQRYAPVEEHCYRAPVVPECHRPQARFELPFPSPLRFIFGR